MTTSQQRAETALRIVLNDLAELSAELTEPSPELDERIDEALCDTIGCPGDCLRSDEDQEQEIADMKQVIETTLGVLRIHLAAYARREFGVELKGPRDAA